MANRGSPEWRQKIAAGRKGKCVGRVVSEETRRKLSEVKRNITVEQRAQRFSDDWRRKISESKHGRLGCKWSEEQRQKSAISFKNRKYTVEGLKTAQEVARRNLDGNSFAGSKHSDASRLKMSESHKGVALPRSVARLGQLSRVKGLILKYCPTRAHKILYNGVWFRNKNEAAFAKWLDDQKITWEYESIAFECLGGKFYIPDFHLIHTNEFVELKGGYVKDRMSKMTDFVCAGNVLSIVDNRSFLKWVRIRGD